MYAEFDRGFQRIYLENKMSEEDWEYLKQVHPELISQISDFNNDNTKNKGLLIHSELHDRVRGIIVEAVRPIKPEELTQENPRLVSLPRPDWYADGGRPFMNAGYFEQDHDIEFVRFVGRASVDLGLRYIFRHEPMDKSYKAAKLVPNPFRNLTHTSTSR